MENPTYDGVGDGDGDSDGDGDGDGGGGMDGAVVNEDEDVAARFPMPAQRGTSGSSDSARFLMPARNPANRIDEEANQIQEDEMDEDGANVEVTENDNDENMMRDVITVECQKLNGKQFIGTVNFSEAKVKIFQDGLGLDAGLLGTVKITFNKCPVVTFKLKSKINVTHGIQNLQPTFSRIYHTKGVLKTDTITQLITKQRVAG